MQFHPFWAFRPRMAYAWSLEKFPSDAGDLPVLFDVLLFEKVIHELLNELTHRPEMVRIPLLGILQALEVGA